MISALAAPPAEQRTGSIGSIGRGWERLVPIVAIVGREGSAFGAAPFDTDGVGPAGECGGERRAHERVRLCHEE
eukprot:6691137-Prymnesium_polylepis.5